jgi:hypothetical protein
MGNYKIRAYTGTYISELRKRLRLEFCRQLLADPEDLLLSCDVDVNSDEFTDHSTVNKNATSAQWNQEIRNNLMKPCAVALSQALVRCDQFSCNAASRILLLVCVG